MTAPRQPARAVIAALLLAGLGLSACTDEHPGRHHRRDRDHHGGTGQYDGRVHR